MTLSQQSGDPAHAEPQETAFWYLPTLPLYGQVFSRHNVDISKKTPRIQPVCQCPNVVALLWITHRRPRPELAPPSDRIETWFTRERAREWVPHDPKLPLQRLTGGHKTGYDRYGAWRAYVHPHFDQDG